MLDVSPAKTKKNAAIDTLRISEQEYRRVLAQLDEKSLEAKIKSVQRRRSPRFAHAVHFVIRISHPGGTTCNYIVRGRDVSASGLSFLHGSFLHKGARCLVLLPGRVERWVQVPATIVRCRHLERRTHELGVHFDEPVDLSVITDACERPEPTVNDDEPSGPLDEAGIEAVVDEFTRSLLDGSAECQDDGASF